MPFQTNGVRDYGRELQWEKKNKPERVKQRAQRNKARSMMMKAGKAKKGDGKDVGHIKAISKGGLSQLYNIQMQTRSSNRSFSRNKDGSMKSEISKRERTRGK